MTLQPAGAVPAAREGACVARLAGTTVLEIRGTDALELLGRLSTADLAPLAAGAAVTTLFLSAEGRLLHRVLLVPGDAALVALAERAGPDAEPLDAWIERYTFTEDVAVRALADHDAILVVGRDALSVAAARPLAGLRWAERPFGPLPATHAFGPGDSVAALVDRLVEAGVMELDDASFLQLRVEAGVPGGGAELTPEHFPAEAGLLHEVSFTKGCYTGQEVVARQDTYGKVARRLVGLAFPSPPSAGVELAGGARSGRVTSVAPAAPGDEGGAACLGYVRTRDARPAAPVVTADGLEGVVVDLPFPRLR